MRVTVPPANAVAFACMPSMPPPFAAVGETTDTSPVGVPVAGATAATVTFAVTAVPCVMAPGVALLLIKSVVADPLKLPTAVPHAVTRLVTFTEPSPVAKS